MTLLIISTIRRGALLEESSGMLLVFDTEKKVILKRSAMVEPPHRDRDPNPRGGIRGARGLDVRGDLIAVTNHNVIMLFDPHWKPAASITHPACADIHDIAFRDDSLWVTSTINDTLIEFDLSGQIRRLFYMRNASPALKALEWHPALLTTAADILAGVVDFRDPSIPTLDPDKKQDSANLNYHDGSHLNSLAFAPDGKMYFSFGKIVRQDLYNLIRLRHALVAMGLWSLFVSVNRFLRIVFRIPENPYGESIYQTRLSQSAVCLFDAKGQHSLSFCIDKIEHPSHSVLIREDGKAVYLNTTTGSVVLFDVHEEKMISSTPVQAEFLRGMCELPDGTLALGDQNRIIFFDLLARKVIDQTVLSPDPRDSVFAIKILPDHFDLPPDSLEEVTGKISSFYGQKVFFS